MQPTDVALRGARMESLFLHQTGPGDWTRVRLPVEPPLKSQNSIQTVENKHTAGPGSCPMASTSCILPVLVQVAPKPQKMQSLYLRWTDRSTTVCFLLPPTSPMLRGIFCLYGRRLSWLNRSIKGA